jgi:hypothetical protein
MKKIDSKSQKEMINSFKLFVQKNIVKKKVIIPLLLIIIGISYYNLFYKIPVKKELSEIARIANSFKEQNKIYGLIDDKIKSPNCFSGNTFLKVPEMQNILNSPDVENISCQFKRNGPVVEEWSVTIVRKEKAYCEDSSGARTETPGLTTTYKCDGSI